MNNFSSTPTEGILLHDLSERVKELTLLHKTARLLHDEKRSPEELIREIVDSIPVAWQYPEITTARIRFGELCQQSGNFKESQWIQTAKFNIQSGEEGAIEVCYLAEKDNAVDGPFLAEERELINSLADMLRAYFQRQADDEALQRAYGSLEQQVRDRTTELNEINAALREEITEHLKAQERIEAYQVQLRKMASELSLAEERERRIIASDLHDHIGQALAFIKMKMTEFKGNSIFCGQEESIDEILRLINQTITYTRSLTFEISSPVLYELGIGPAIDWLAETFNAKHKLKISVKETGHVFNLPEEIKIVIFKSVRELLVNVVKHANASKADIVLNWIDHAIEISVHDDGDGFLHTGDDYYNVASSGFGLFSIRERVTHFGGDTIIESIQNQGSCIILKVPIENEK
ncbi:hypothetical protein K9N50_05595 [bacterium]|nr:hypothetical protein [bacterium]